MLDIYEYKTGEQHIADKGSNPLEVDRIEYENGIRVFIKGHKYPCKGAPTAHALFIVSQIKSVFLSSIRVFSWRLLTVSLNKLIKGFNEVCFKVIKQGILKENYRLVFTNEFYKFLLTFLVEYGIDKKEAEMFAITLAHIFEYDNAYRIRLQDLFGSTTKERLIKFSRKEVKRLMAINRDRDFKDSSGTESVSGKFARITKLISLALLFPRVKRAFKKSVEQMNIIDLQFDRGDVYWMLQRTDYDYLGLNFEQRLEIFKNYE